MSINTDTNQKRHDRCSGIELLLTEYSAGELDHNQVVVVESHLENCAECRAELAREIYLRGSLADLPVVPCPDRVTESLLDVIDGKVDQPVVASAKPSLSRHWTSFVGWAAAAAAVILILTNPLDTVQTTTDPAAQPQWSEAEIRAARQDLKRSLLLTARYLDHTERSTVKEVFGQTLPESISRSLKTLLITPEGGQG